MNMFGQCSIIQPIICEKGRFRQSFGIVFSVVGSWHPVPGW